MQATGISNVQFAVDELKADRAVVEKYYAKHGDRSLPEVTIMFIPDEALIELKFVGLRLGMGRYLICRDILTDRGQRVFSRLFKGHVLPSAFVVCIDDECGMEDL